MIVWKGMTTFIHCHFCVEWDKMKQLDVVVSPPAFVWNPYLTLTHVTFDLDPRGQISTKLQKVLEKNHVFPAL